MQEQAAIQNLLRTKLAEIQRGNPKYSLRSYANKVGVHVGALSYIINGKRAVSRKLAERIAARLHLDPQERSELLSLFPRQKKRSAEGEWAQPKYLEISAAQFTAATEWEHLAVLSLMNCEAFESSPQWIADRLGITPSRASLVISRLLKLELITLDAFGNWKRSAGSLRTSDDIAEVSIQKHHLENLELAGASLARDGVHQRDFTSITMAIDPKKISVAKERIRQFEDELSELLESGNRTEVFRLSMQLFPLSQLKKPE